MDETPYYYVSTPPGGARWQNTRGDRRDFEVGSERDVDPAPSLDREGFELSRHAAAPIDVADAEGVRSRYFADIEALVRARAGAARVVAFDWNVHCGPRAAEREPGFQAPVRFVHNDYTERSGPQRVRDLLPDEAEALLAGRFAVINAWRPLRGPVLDTPLAFCDPRTLGPDDLVPTELRYAGA